MSVIKARYDIFDIYIEPLRKVITVRQRWKYNWLESASASKFWTYNAKKSFHDAVDRVIWNQWSGNYYASSRLKSIESSSNKNSFLFKNYQRKRYTINFDIEWVTTNPHWTANVTHIAPSESYNSRVNHESHEVFLASTDFENSIVDKECNLSFNTASHEFGHMIGAGDEYGEKYMSERAIEFYENIEETTRFDYEDDYESRMNIGGELRDRFITLVDDCLDEMIPEVKFTALLTKKYVESINGRY